MFSHLRRWWRVTTDRDFLVSSASRRTAWKFLLPLPGILALLSDAGDVNLMILDVYVTVALLLVAYLPPGNLWSDVAIALVHGIFYSAHSFIFVREQVTHGDVGTHVSVPWGCQILCIFGMASAGVHSVALAGFNAFVAVTPYLLLGEYALHHVDMGQVIACMYVMAAAGFAEGRLAVLVCELSCSDFGYKALMLDSSVETDAPGDFLPLATASPDEGMATDGEGMEKEAHTFPHSDSEDSEDLEDLKDLAAQPPSRSSLADCVLSHLTPRQTSRRSSSAREQEVLLQPLQEAQVLQPKFAASMVQMPAAAEHEAPEFRELLRQESFKTRRQRSLSPGARSTPPGSPGSPGSPGGGLVLRGIKMYGFRATPLNVLYIESRDSMTRVNGRETYWSEGDDYFLFYSKVTDTWGIASAKRFEAVISGKSFGLAQSPKGMEIWEPADSRRRVRFGDWREWDGVQSKWVSRMHSGIQSRGKVRPKATFQTAAVQTEPIASLPPVHSDSALRDQECQTDPSGHASDSSLSP